jgi:hypothetical protein
MRLRICTVRQAQKFNAATHRRLPTVQGAMWAARVADGDRTIGVALVGAPARVWNGDTLNVLRCAVEPGNPNACSMLYGACARAARALGADNLVTYTHGDEHGTSLRASGWIYGGVTKGGDWDRADRQRDLPIDAAPKHRWWAPWSARANQPAATEAP